MRFLKGIMKRVLFWIEIIIGDDGKSLQGTEVFLVVYHFTLFSRFVALLLINSSMWWESQGHDSAHNCWCSWHKALRELSNPSWMLEFIAVTSARISMIFDRTAVPSNQEGLVPGPTDTQYPRRPYGIIQKMAYFAYNLYSPIYSSHLVITYNI